MNFTNNTFFQNQPTIKRIVQTIGRLLLTFSLIAQIGWTQQGRYQRKSIAYVDALLLTDKATALPAGYERYLLSTIHDNIRLSRFDYNQLPDNLQQRFRNTISGRTFTEYELGDLISRELGPAIIQVLDIEKEARAQNLLSEAQRNSFIVLKAKEMGITAEQIEQVLNAAYLYVPFLSNYQVSKPKDDKDITVTIEVGLIYYHLITGDEPRFDKVTSIRSSGAGSADKNKTYDMNDGTISAVEYAFRSAVHSVAMNLQVMTRDISLFRLKAPIAAIERRTVHFPLGRKEGIHLDEPFYVGEYFQKSDGKVKFQKSGFVRVSTVADDNQPGRQLSTAYAIKKGDWSKGMTLIEHPRLPLDFAVKPRWFDLTMDEGVFASDKFLVVFSDYKGICVGADFDLQINIAELTKKRQSFLVLGGTVGAASVKSAVYSTIWDFIFPDERSVAIVVDGYAGYLRRFYLGPLALHYEGLLGVQRLILSDTYDHKPVSIANNTVGLRLNLGLEYALNIDTNLGLFAGLQIFPPLDLWTIKYKDKEIDVDNLANFAAPRIYSLSPTFGLYIHYSLPSLSVNPTAMVQSSLSKQLKSLP